MRCLSLPQSTHLLLGCFQGVVHVIDRVLIPGSATDPTDPADGFDPDQPSDVSDVSDPTQPGPNQTVAQTIVDIAVADPENFSTLVDLLTLAGLVDTLNGEGPFTVRFDRATQVMGV